MVAQAGKQFESRMLIKLDAPRVEPPQLQKKSSYIACVAVGLETLSRPGAPPLPGVPLPQPKVPGPQVTTAAAPGNKSSQQGIWGIWETAALAWARFADDV